MTVETHRKGRPEIKEQISMREKIGEYYEKNISAATTARETGHDIKTVYKIFGELADMEVESQKTIFGQKKNVVRIQRLAYYQHLKLRLQQVLDNALDQMSKPHEKGVAFPKIRADDITKIINYILALNEKRSVTSLEVVVEDQDLAEREDISEEVIKKIVRYTANETFTERGLCGESDLERGIVIVTKCELSKVKPYIDKMFSLGLRSCMENDLSTRNGEFEKYRMEKFAEMRGYTKNGQWE